MKRAGADAAAEGGWKVEGAQKERRREGRINTARYGRLHTLATVAATSSHLLAPLPLGSTPLQMSSCMCPS